MSDADLNQFLSEFTRALFDPTAPLPALWPVGAMGVFLVFATQIGAGIPLGVIMARNAGLSPLTTAGLYLASDVVLAVTMEPMLALLRWLGARVAFIGRIGKILARVSGGAGLKEGGVRGPLGLVLFSFSVSPTAGRAASEAAGHGFFSGWSLAILGDMGYFTLIMLSTLWASSLFGDDRLTIGAVLLGTWLLPTIIGRLQNRGRGNSQPHAQPAALRPAEASVTTMGITAAPARVARKRPNHTGRPRRTRR